MIEVIIALVLLWKIGGVFERSKIEVDKLKR